MARILSAPSIIPATQARVVALKGEGLSLLQIAAGELLSPLDVRKVPEQIGAEMAM